jgi:hypothetical protein
MIVEELVKIDEKLVNIMATTDWPFPPFCSGSTIVLFLQLLLIFFHAIKFHYHCDNGEQTKQKPCGAISKENYMSESENFSLLERKCHEPV